MGRILATKKGLTTNKKLDEFLEISAERARVLLAGKHKYAISCQNNFEASFISSGSQLPIGQISPTLPS